jgi:hypothetical protein
MKKLDGADWFIVFLLGWIILVIITEVIGT